MEFWAITHQRLVGGQKIIEVVGIVRDHKAGIGWAIEQIERMGNRVVSHSQSTRLIAEYNRAGVAPNAGDKPIGALDPDSLLPDDDVSVAYSFNSEQYTFKRVSLLDFFT